MCAFVGSVCVFVLGSLDSERFGLAFCSLCTLQRSRSFPGYSESVEELPAGFCCVKLDLLGRAVCERDPAMAEWGTLTTVMVRQLPSKYTQIDLFGNLVSSGKVQKHL